MFSVTIEVSPYALRNVVEIDEGLRDDAAMGRGSKNNFCSL